MATHAFEELDYQQTPLGDLILRRRASMALGGRVVYEVTIGGEFLMSSAVNDAEVALARLGLAPLEGRSSHVLVAGLGLGHTAAAALESPGVRRVTVVEYLDAVLAWHRRGLVPLGKRLVEDPRCELLHADFFALVGSPPRDDDGRYDAILVDIDHSPEALLQPAHAAFYARAGVERVRQHLVPDGTLALWSADPPGADFVAALAAAFASVCAHRIEFYNPMVGEEDSNTIVVARR